MNPFKRKGTLRLILLLGTVLLIFMATFLITNNHLYNDYKKSVNNVISGVINEVKEKYPKVEEDELVDLFNNEDNYKDNQTLIKYGLNHEEISIVKGLEESYQRNVWVMVFLLLSLLVTVIILIIWYVIKEERKLLKLSNYVNDLVLKKDSLKLEENEEGMISKLQNDLYKLTVVLREAYDNESRERLEMKKSLEDISHQLKTPLTAMMITLDNLSNDELKPDLRKSFLEDVKRQVDKMNFLIKSLLKLSRFDAGVIKFKSENIRVKNLVNDVIKSVSVLAEINDVKIKANGDDNTSFTGDYNWQLEAVTNVVKNAVEHSTPGETVTIKFRENAVYTLISVVNHGNVINEQDMKNIFTRFYKGKNATYESIGIGLSLSKSIIEKGGGYVRVSSSKKDGTRFDIKYLKR
ncbi:MAG: HAMP domain-containing sensor histidine kinase [Bacilli bacterium]|nr:HAMP domain-containing sensor histidine kinase [Bacilli bacterium]